MADRTSPTVELQDGEILLSRIPEQEDIPDECWKLYHHGHGQLYVLKGRVPLFTKEVKGGVFIGYLMRDDILKSDADIEPLPTSFQMLAEAFDEVSDALRFVLDPPGSPE